MFKYTKRADKPIRMMRVLVIGGVDFMNWKKILEDIGVKIVKKE